jgi:hypothetical protein
VNLKYVTILKPQDLQTNCEITCTQFCAIDLHKGRKAMYSSTTKVEYATDITLGRIVRFKKLWSATQKWCKKFCYAGARTACRLVPFIFSATFGDCLVGILCLSAGPDWPQGRSGKCPMGRMPGGPAAGLTRSIGH